MRVPSTLYPYLPLVVTDGQDHSGPIPIPAPNDPPQTGTDFTLTGGIVAINTAGLYQFTVSVKADAGDPVTDWAWAQFELNDGDIGPTYYFSSFCTPRLSAPGPIGFVSYMQMLAVGDRLRLYVSQNYPSNTTLEVKTTRVSASIVGPI